MKICETRVKTPETPEQGCSQAFISTGYQRQTNFFAKMENFFKNIWRSFSKCGEVFQNMEKFIKVFEKFLKVFEKIFRGFGIGIKTDYHLRRFSK